MVKDKEFEIRLLPSSVAADRAMIATLVTLVNKVYAVAEDGLWADGVQRTSAAELAQVVKQEELAVSVRDGRPVGCVRIQRLDDEVGEFGVLAADPACRGIGIGRELVRFAEQHARDWGCSTMQLEVLVPRDWKHPAKEFLDQWYRRIGYRVIRTVDFAEYYPDLSSLLATPCTFCIYQKNIAIA